jgi:DNA uptake protein ComE-like DNA-binding protein
MATKATQDATELLQHAVETLESPKGSVAAGVRMLRRAAMLLSEREIRTWCEIQLGNAMYTRPLQTLMEKWDAAADKKNDAAAKKELDEAYAAVAKAGITLGQDITDEELSIKWGKSSGGLANIGFVEERYADLVRTKIGNDGTYYKNNLSAALNYVRRVAHARAARLYNRVAYADAPQTAFDVLKRAVDDRLLDYAPDLAEQLIAIFRALALESSESRSQALASCRRFFEALANTVYPAPVKSVTDESDSGGRSLGEANFINRLWAFMDSAIASETNRELAKRHVDFLGAYLEKVYRITNKGVHATVSQVEATKAVFHTYLVVADLIEYLPEPSRKSDRLNIHKASLDELESVLNVKRSVAKAIVRLRAERGEITPQILRSIPGLGPKTLARIQECASFEKPKGA